MKIEGPFPGKYEVEPIDDLPGNGKFKFPLHFFPRPENEMRESAWWLKIIPEDAEPWIGVFEHGYTSPPAISGVVSTANPCRACVIAHGSAYIVNVEKPSIWEEVSLMPVLDVRASLEEEILIFSDFTRIKAYGTSGLLWESPRLCWDDLKITNITPDTIEATDTIQWVAARKRCASWSI